MNSLIGLFLPLALAVVMFGLGLTLTVQDFVRVAKAPKAAVIALVCQIVVLPVVCLGLVLLFQLEPPLAIGMMLLAAAPGGVTANLFSFLAGGDVALNISLTAINSILAVVTMPIVVSLAIDGFLGSDASIGLQPSKTVQVFATLLVPVAIGMWVNRRFAGISDRMRRPVKIGSFLALALAILATLGRELDTLAAHAGTVGVVALLLSVCSFAVGYYVPRFFKIGVKQSIASAMEIGIHNPLIAMTIAFTVLNSPLMAVPAGMYGTVMFLPATVAAIIFARRTRALRSQPQQPELAPVG